MRRPTTDRDPSRPPTSPFRAEAVSAHGRPLADLGRVLELRRRWHAWAFRVLLAAWLGILVWLVSAELHGEPLLERLAPGIAAAFGRGNG